MLQHFFKLLWVKKLINVLEMVQKCQTLDPFIWLGLELESVFPKIFDNLLTLNFELNRTLKFDLFFKIFFGFKFRTETFNSFLKTNHKK